MVKNILVTQKIYHQDFDVELIQSKAELIVDLRNMVKEASENVYKL